MGWRNARWRDFVKCHNSATMTDGKEPSLLEKLDLLLTQVFSDATRGVKPPTHAIEIMTDCCWKYQKGLWYDDNDDVDVLGYKIETTYDIARGPQVVIVYGTRTTSENPIAFVLDPKQERPDMPTTDDDLDEDD